jgi:hypothetical protein
MYVKTRREAMNAQERLGFGRHASKPLYRVPESYLEWLLNTRDDRPETQEMVRKHLIHWRASKGVLRQVDFS